MHRFQTSVPKEHLDIFVIPGPFYMAPGPESGLHPVAIGSWARRAFVMEICREIDLPPKSTLGTSKNNFLEPFEPGPQGLIMCLRINQTV